MKRIDGTFLLSASDLANHIACRHLTSLNRAVAEARMDPPPSREDLDLLRELGDRHERDYLAHLESQGLALSLAPDGESAPQATTRLLDAMRSGVDVIVQALLADGRWHGRADVLRRVERPSRIGSWSYEVYDTKLAIETRAGSVLQLCLYSDLLARVQGLVPEHMHIVPPRPEFPPESYRVADFAAYYRLVRRQAEEAADASDGAAPYPEPVPHCDICSWWKTCEDRRRADDHLSLVASISRQQTRELETRGIPTLAALAGQPTPLAWKPKRGAKESYERAREQARVQLAGRVEGRPVHEWLPLEAGRGLARLPEESPGDVFLDLEGDPYVRDGGLEYLFGWASRDDSGVSTYRRIWALDRVGERAAFEAFVDDVMARWDAHPGMHVYHFAPYEPAALKRLMGRYATREAEIDRLLWGQIFVDLHRVVRQALRASVEEYSIKKMEAVFSYTRAQTLPEAGVHLRGIQRALELGKEGDISEETRRIVEAYNKDDCFAAMALYDWLERERSLMVRNGAVIERPGAPEAKSNEAAAENDARTRALAERLIAGVPEDAAERTPEQHATWILAHLLEFHRREQKAPWWEYFSRREMSEEELLEENAALSGLQFVEAAGGTARSPIHRYQFPKQETSVRIGHKLHAPLPDGREVGDVVAIDLIERVTDIKKRMTHATEHPRALFSHKMFSTPMQKQAIFCLGEWAADHGIDAPGPYRAARDLLLRLPPRFTAHQGGELRHPGETGIDAARRLLPLLDHTVLGIQGPPGSGKTVTGAQMILDAVRLGKKVGVCAGSHDVIRNLLDRVAAEAGAQGETVRCAHKPDEMAEGSGAILQVKTNEEALALLTDGRANVLGGTAWLWSRPEFAESVDYLFVDEAGQVALGNVLAIALAAATVVLLGDPRQLNHPIQGSHPEGTEVSALEYLLNGEPTIAPDRGIFLDETWRLHPSLCEVTSELFYANRLKARDGLELQTLLSEPTYGGAGIRLVPVEHEGCRSASREEVEVVCSLVEALTLKGVRWRDRSGREHQLTLEDVLIMAPYNAQVADLTAAIPHARIGTVDRFQGQEAPVVIYSMTTSSPEDVPRGMEFFYSPNRINVATSRARCACILVGNPRIFRPECRTPHQMKLANAFCRFREAADATQLLVNQAQVGSTP